MSAIIPRSAYIKENKKHRRSTRVQRKVKLPSNMKTKGCNTSDCKNPAVTSFQIENRTIHLCKGCLRKYKDRNERHPVIFTRASSWFAE